jgi:hypothetical protein
MLPAMTVRLITPPADPAAPDAICQVFDAGRELADAMIDAEPGLRDIERVGLRLGIALLRAWLKPASCPAPS